MSNIRLFFKESLSLNLISNLDKSQSHYLSKVMRINIGQSFSLFNQSGEWEAKIKEINKEIVEFSVIKKLRSANNKREILSIKLPNADREWPLIGGTIAVFNAPNTAKNHTTKESETCTIRPF